MCSGTVQHWHYAATVDDARAATPLLSDGGAATKHVPHRRIAALDGLRGVAIAVVLVTHVTALIAPGWPGRVLTGGFLGLDLFFVLSGFLITSLVLERRSFGERGLSRFYLRRFLRIVPAVTTMVVVVCLYMLLAGTATITDVVYSAGMTMTGAVSFVIHPAYYTSPHWLAPLGIVWSLGVEESFYLLWPALLLTLLARGANRTIIVVVAVVLAGATVVRSTTLWHATHDWTQIYFRTDVRAGELFIGSALAVAAPAIAIGTRSARAVSIASCLAFTVLFVCFFALEPSDSWLYQGGFIALALIAAVVVLAAADGRSIVNRLFELRVLVGLGRISYSLYLWHYPIFLLLAPKLESTAVRFAVCAIVTALATFISYRWIERPGMSLSRQIAPEPGLALRAEVAG